MKITVRTLWRMLIYVVGVFALAFSVAIAVNSDLGVSSVNSLPYALSIVTGVPLSQMVVIVFCGFIVLQAVLLRRQFKWWNVFQILCSTLFGYFTGFAQSVMGDFCLPGYGGRLAMSLCSILLVAVGVVLTVDMRLVVMPPEGLTLALAQVSGLRFPTMKNIQDCVSVSLAALITLVATGSVSGVREGTVLSALLVGRIIALLRRLISPHLERICFEK